MKLPYNYKKYKIAADFDLIFNYIMSSEYSVYYTSSIISSIEAKGESNKNIFLTISEYKNIVLGEVDFYWVRIYYSIRFIDAFIRESIKLLLPEFVIDFVRNKI